MPEEGDTLELRQFNLSHSIRLDPKLHGHGHGQGHNMDTDTGIRQFLKNKDTTRRRHGG